jgi:hypothetical protein
MGESRFDKMVEAGNAFLFENLNPFALGDLLYSLRRLHKRTFGALPRSFGCHFSSFDSIKTLSASTKTDPRTGRVIAVDDCSDSG